MASTSSTEFNKELQKWKKERAALSEKELRRPRVSGERALELSQRLVTSWQEVETSAKQQLAPSHLTTLNTNAKNLQSLAKAFYAADLFRETHWESKKKKRLKELQPKNSLTYSLIKLRWGGKDKSIGCTFLQS